MRFMAVVMLAFVLTTGFMSTAEAASCDPGTVEIGITSAADVRSLTDSLACEGQGNFHIKWHSNVAIDERIDVSDGKNVTVTADTSDEDNAAGVTIDAGSGTGIFSVSDGSTLRLNNIELEGGDAEDGGAVAVLSSSTLFVFGCTFARNNASTGGAIFASDSSIYVDGSTSFEENTALYGGAVYTYDSELGINGSAMFTHNSAGDFGGAIIVDLSELSISGNATFTSNSARYGGAVYTSDSELGINGSAMFTHNSAGEWGGAVYALESNVSLNGTTQFSSNSAFERGGRISFLDNAARGLGGAMYMENPNTLHVIDVAFEANKATLGGAVYILSGLRKGALFISCEFKGNVAEDGGAAYLNSGLATETFTGTLFQGNVALTSGGAIFQTGTLNVINTSFVENMGLEGPAVMSIGSIATLVNVHFLDNHYRCLAGQYSDIVTTKAGTCSRCFDEVCSRCSYESTEVDDIRTSGYPICVKEVPLGATASSGTTLATLSIKRGYYRTSTSSAIVLECFRKRACLGGIGPETHCASGYTGPYCAVCADGFVRGAAFSCRPCSGGAGRLAVGLTICLGFAGLLVATLLLYHLGKVVPDVPEQSEEYVGRSGIREREISSWSALLVKVLPLVAIKIVVTVWQTIYQLGAVAGDIYPELYDIFVSHLYLANLQIDYLVPYSCMIDHDFYDRLLFTTIAPLVGLVMLAGSYLVAKKRNSRSESATHAVLHKHVAVGIYVASLVYSPASFMAFQTFVCDEIGDGNINLRADYRIDCTAHRHRGYKAYALIMVGVYAIGIPAVFAWLLRRHRHDLVKPDRDSLVHLKPLSGIWVAYRPSRYYFEVVECVRRIGLIGAFSLPNTTEQLVIIFVIAVLFSIIAEVLSPFDKKRDTILYRWGNVIIVFSMYGALLMKIDVAHDQTQAMLAYSGAAIAANLVMAAIVLVEMVVLVKTYVWLIGTVMEVDTPARRTA